MVQFGATLTEQRHKAWEEFYIDYNGLKRQLKALKAAYDEASQVPHGSSASSAPSSWEASPLGMTRWSPVSPGGEQHPMSLRGRIASRYSLMVGEDVEALEEKFSETLDSEVEKVVLFFLAKQGELAKLLLDAKRGASNGTFGLGLAEVEEGHVLNQHGLVVSSAERQSIYCGIGRQIAELMRFLQLNVSGLRKILKKHDKQIRDKLIANNYLSTRAQAKYSSMRQLYNNAGVMALVGSLRNAFEVAEAENIRAAQFSIEPEMVARTDEEGEHMRKDSAEEAMGHHRLVKRQSLRSFRAAVRSLSEISSTEGVLEEVANAQRALAEAQQLTTSKYLSRQVLFDAWELAAVDEGTERTTARELHRPSAFINLATTFLYMTNYYIVGPTSAEYAAALGGSPAVSGLIIGMTPIAACFSCLLYSWWTNKSFRGPLLLCSVMLVFGNLLYGLALSYDAFWMVLVGRMLIGLGGARGVNRRYIADTIPIESRTAYSAAFVAVGALGMAFGPFCSAVMNGINFTAWGVTFNGLTNPGWSMFVSWVVMGLIVHFEFQEPPHYMSSNSDAGSDEDGPSKKLSSSSINNNSSRKNKNSERLVAKRAAVADNGGNAGSSSNSSSGTYGSTTTAMLSSPAVASGKVVAVTPNGSAAAAQDDERAKLVPRLQEAAGSGGQAKGDEDDEDEEDRSSGAGSAGGEKHGGLGAITRPLGFCLFGYFVNKLITEAAVSSAPVLTQYLFDWSVREVGVLMAVLGLVVLPVNAMVGRLSMVYEDRVLLQWLAVLAGVGCIIMVDFSASPFAYTQTQYIAGVSLVFVALQAHEGVIMSVTSKVIPAELARGTWNSGFLATEAGTFGRFVGDAFITVLGVMTLSWLDFLLFVPSAVLVVLMLLGFWMVYPFLQGQ